MAGYSRLRFQRFKKYVRYWTRLFGMDHFEWEIVNVSTPHPDGDTIHACIESFPENLKYRVLVFPRAWESLDEQELWDTACHEVLHAVLDPFVRYMNRFNQFDQAGTLAQALWDGSNESLESVVWKLSVSLCERLPVTLATGTGSSRLPVSLVSGTMETLPKGENNADRHSEKLVAFPSVSEARGRGCPVRRAS